VPTTQRATAMPPEERRRAIIAVTRPLIIEHGAAVTTKQIACAAGVAEGTIFRVFADKDELLLATIEDSLDMAPFESAVAAIDADLAFEDQLAAAVVLIQRRIADVWAVVSSVGSQMRDRVERPLASSAALAALLTRNDASLSIDAAEAARMLRALVLSMSHPMLGDGASEPTDIVQFFLHGVAP
jgi:AcrR family transcriptional regulator